MDFDIPRPLLVGRSGGIIGDPTNGEAPMPGKTEAGVTGNAAEGFPFAVVAIEFSKVW